MTHRTIGWQVQDRMFRVQTRVVVWQMASIAGIRGIIVIALVAGITIVGYRNMRSGKRINGIVVKRRGYPGRFAVALRTIDGKLLGNVIGRSSLHIIIIMASITSIWRVIIIPVVTHRAIICNGSVGPIQCIKGIVNRKCGRRPAGCRGMALGTIGW